MVARESSLCSCRRNSFWIRRAPFRSARRRRIVARSPSETFRFGLVTEEDGFESEDLLLPLPGSGAAACEALA